MHLQDGGGGGARFHLHFGWRHIQTTYLLFVTDISRHSGVCALILGYDDCF